MLSIWTCVFKMADHCGNLALAARNSDLKKELKKIHVVRKVDVGPSWVSLT
jgi:hypothetical protein